MVKQEISTKANDEPQMDTNEHQLIDFWTVVDLLSGSRRRCMRARRPRSRGASVRPLWVYNIGKTSLNGEANTAGRVRRS